MKSEDVLKVIEDVNTRYKFNPRFIIIGLSIIPSLASNAKIKYNIAVVAR